MLKNINKYYFILAIVFVLIYIANIVTPVIFDDDFLYGNYGNPFLLQKLEYLTFHGRFTTHFIGRLILQTRDPWSNLLTSLLVMFLVVNITNFITPYFWKKENQDQSTLPLLICLALIFAFMVGSWTTFTETTQVFAYHLSYGLILLFLFPYFQIIQNPLTNKTNSLLIFIIGLFTGNTHEQVASVALIVALIFIYLYYKKISIPSWMWFGIVGLFIGICVLILSPGTTSGARTGSFSTLFDISKYFKAFLYILFFNDYAWAIYGMPSFITFGILLYNNIKAEKDFLHALHIVPVLMFILAWACTGILVVSPENYYGRTANFGLFFLYISVALIFRSHLILYPQSISFVKKITITLVSTSLAFYVVLFPVWLDFNKKYYAIVAQINDAKSNNLNSVTISPLTQFKIQTPFGAIIPMYIHLSPRYYQRMANYYEINSINVKE